MSEENEEVDEDEEEDSEEDSDDTEEEDDDEMPDLNEWLEENSSIAEAIIWEDDNGNIAYPNWTKAQKKNLADMFTKAWNSEFFWDEDPMPNMEELEDDENIIQSLDKSHAWTMFLSYIAQSLAMEIGEELDWSITDYSENGLAQLFDSRNMFVYDQGSETYVFGWNHGSTLPCDPQTTYKFLTKKEIIQEERVDTIAKMLDWCREHLEHYVGGHDTKNIYDQWQYRGLPPVVRILKGIPTLTEPELGKRHITQGCWGTVGFLKAVLRVINIPVELVCPSNHAHPYFVEDGLYLSHGDDLYNAFVFTEPPMPISELLIDQKTFEEWFNESLSEDENDKNVGRRVVELSLKYISKYILEQRQQDIDEEKDHAESAVYKNYKDYYSVEELEEIGLWKKLDKKLKSLDD